MNKKKEEVLEQNYMTCHTKKKFGCQETMDKKKKKDLCEVMSLYQDLTKRRSQIISERKTNRLQNISNQNDFSISPESCSKEVIS
jgi:hypothetical protein